MIDKATVAAVARELGLAWGNRQRHRPGRHPHLTALVDRLGLIDRLDPAVGYCAPGYPNWSARRIGPGCWSTTVSPP